MKINKFEEFLTERHAAEYKGAKDTMVDNFEYWLSRLDIDEWLNYGEWYGNKLAKEEIEKHIKNLKLSTQP